MLPNLSRNLMVVCGIGFSDQNPPIYEHVMHLWSPYAHRSNHYLEFSELLWTYWGLWFCDSTKVLIWIWMQRIKWHKIVIQHIMYLFLHVSYEELLIAIIVTFYNCNTAFPRYQYLFLHVLYEELFIAIIVTFYNVQHRFSKVSVCCFSLSWHGSCSIKIKDIPQHLIV